MSFLQWVKYSIASFSYNKVFKYIKLCTKFEFAVHRDIPAR